MAAIIKSNLNSSLSGIVENKWRTIQLKNKDTYLNNYVVHGAINILADDASSLPLRVYRGDQVVPDDFILPGNFNLKHPHLDLSLASLLHTCYIYYWYRGEFMIYIDLDSPMTLEPINPKLMEIEKRDAFNNIISWKWNRKLSIPKEQLIYSARINPDGERGLAITDVLEKELDNYDSAREFNTRFFKNFGKVGGTLYDDKGEIGPDTMDNLVSQFNEAHEGADNAYKTLGLPQGIKYQEFVQTMREMEFLQSNKDLRDRILNTFGIHKSVFGATDSVDRAVAEAAEKQKWTKTLQPVTRRIEEAFNQGLFRRYFPAFRCAFDYDNVSALQEDRTEKLSRAKILHELGYTTNEINETLQLGMNDITDVIGDMRFVPNALTPVDEFLIESESPADKNINSSNKLDSVDKINTILDKKIKISSYKIKYDRVNRKIQRSIQKKLGKFFSDQLGEVLAVVHNKGVVDTTTKTNSTEMLIAIKNIMEQGKEKISHVVEPVLNEGSIKASELALNTLNIDMLPKLNKIVVEKRLNKIKGINNYTYKLLRLQIKDGINAGDSIEMLSKRVIKVYKFNKSRARTIAITESGAVMNGTTFEEYKDNGVEKKEWIGGNRPSHAAQDGKVIGINEVFPNGCAYPGDTAGGAAECVNCTCTLSPVVV